MFVILWIYQSQRFFHTHTFSMFAGKAAQLYALKIVNSWFSFLSRSVCPPIRPLSVYSIVWPKPPNFPIRIVFIITRFLFLCRYSVVFSHDPFNIIILLTGINWLHISTLDVFSVWMFVLSTDTHTYIHTHREWEIDRKKTHCGLKRDRLEWMCVFSVKRCMVLHVKHCAPNKMLIKKSAE